MFNWEAWSLDLKCCVYHGMSCGFHVETALFCRFLQTVTTQQSLNPLSSVAVAASAPQPLRADEALPRTQRLHLPPPPSVCPLPLP